MPVIPRFCAICVGFVFVALAAASGAEPAAPATGLSVADRDFLKSLLKEIVVDPTGKRYVQVTVSGRACSGAKCEYLRDGWYSPGTNGDPGRVFFADGETLPAPPRMSQLDFVKYCDVRYGDEKCVSMYDLYARQQIIEPGEPSDVVIAAWLYRLGHEQLAGKAMACAKRRPAEADDENDHLIANWLFQEGDEQLAGRAIGRSRTIDAKLANEGILTAEGRKYAQILRLLRDDLAARAFSGMMENYLWRADELALAHGARLLRLYSDIAKKKYLQTGAIVADLNRRKTSGKFGKTPPDNVPDGFGSWETGRKVALLIASLDEVDAQQDEDNSGVRFMLDDRIRELVRLGDAAVPALIQTVENDNRLCRSMKFDTYEGPRRIILSVSEVALGTVSTILGIRFFTPASASDCFTVRSSEERAKIAATVRNYWRLNGSMPFADRMMKTLTDPNSAVSDAQSAALNLGLLAWNSTPDPEEFLAPRRWLFTTVGDIVDAWSPEPIGLNFHRRIVPVPPALAKFEKPTVAEAILSALDRELAQHPHDRSSPSAESWRMRIEDQYLDPVVRLGDKRITHELGRRYRAADDIGQQRRYAWACQMLGDPGPMKALAGELEKGTLPLPRAELAEKDDVHSPRAEELDTIVADAIHANLPECDRALSALAATNHPYHALITSEVLACDPAFSGQYEQSFLMKHPYVIAVLRQALDDTKSTGQTVTIEDDESLQLHNEKAASDSHGLLADLGDRNFHEVPLRYCDEAGSQIRAMVFGAPFYHISLKDGGARLDRMKKFLDRYQGHFRTLNYDETNALCDGWWQCDNPFAPDIPILNRPATREDVDKCRAIFHLEGKSKLTSLKLPAIARLRTKQEFPMPLNALIVQAEVGEDGKTIYGIITRYDVRTASADELADIKPIGSKAELKEGR